MRLSLIAALLAACALVACESTPPVQQPEEPFRPAEPERPPFRPMDPIADDPEDRPQPPRPPEPPGPSGPTEPPEPIDSPGPGEPAEPAEPAGELESGVCTPLETVNDRHRGPTVFYTLPSGTVSFSADMDVNTDGALTSYSAVDPGSFAGGRLNTRRALNTVCNGLKIVRPGSDLGPTECRELLTAFAKFRDAGWPAKNAAGDRIKFYAIETRTSAGRNEPCLVDDAWMVSTTSIRMSGAYPACDPQAWLDARRVNAIVMPPQVLRKAGASAAGGDLVMVRYRGRMFGGIVGDTNPRVVGEGTLALAQALRALDPQPPPAPSNLLEVYGLAVARPPVEYFVFPGTRSKAEPLTNRRGAEIAQLALQEAAARGLTNVQACGFSASRGRSLGPIIPIRPEDDLTDDPDVLKDEE